MKYISLILITVFLMACAGSKKTTKDSADENGKNYDENNDEYIILLEDLRTQLSDAYAYRENKIPEAFDRIRVEQSVKKDLYEGYRIQIYSGHDVTTADSIAANFRAWSDSTIIGYQPEAYVFFRTPSYRVHVGDFHDRNRAISLSNIIKRYFKDAWVVYDRVNPAYVPADSIDIYTK